MGSLFTKPRSGGGVSDFLGLLDTPSSYATEALKFVRVNSAKDALEFVGQSVIDHTLILNIGTNSHVQIDTHIADGAIHFTEGSIDHLNIQNIGTNSHVQLDTHVADVTIHFTEASIDHTAIQNIGTNSHANIDTHIADVTIHFTVGSIDHTLITNIGTNSHAQLDTHVADSTIHFTEASVSHLNIQDIGTNSHIVIDTHISDSTIHFTEASIDHTAIQNIGTNSHAAIDTHLANTSNPHSVTKTQVGLSNVDNIQQMPLSYLDTDPTLAADSDVKVSSQKAIKEYVDIIVNAAIRLQGDWNANTNTPDITGTTTTGFAWRVSVAGSTNLGGITTWAVGDLAVKTDTGWLKIANQDVAAVWGNISGTLSSQTDLQTALDLKTDETDFQTHITDLTIHFTEASIDHTAIQNIGSNSHATIDTHIADGTIHFSEASISHINIQDIGTNSHAAIDTHIADTTIHFTEASIDHTAIQNIGTNSHANIDTHIADGTIHFTVGSIDHGLLNAASLLDDDHIQYLLANGSRALAGAWDMGDQALTNVNIDSGVITGITDLAIADGGTGASTAQAAIDALSAVSGATNEHVLTKDTGTGNAIWKASGGGGLGDVSIETIFLFMGS